MEPINPNQFAVPYQDWGAMVAKKNEQDARALQIKEYERGLQEQEQTRNALVQLQNLQYQQQGAMQPQQQGVPLNQMPQNALAPQGAMQQPTPQMPQPPQMPQSPQINNYAELMAQQQSTKSFFDQFGSALVSAQETGNNDIKNAITKRAMNSGNPMLAQIGQVIQMADFKGKDTIAYRGSQLKGMDDKTLKILGLTHDQAQDYADNDAVGFTGRIGSQMHPTKIAEQKATSALRQTVSRDYWVKGDHSPVTFDPSTGEYYNADGTQLTPDKLERVPKSTGSGSGSGATGRSYSAGVGEQGQYVVRDSHGALWEPDGHGGRKPYKGTHIYPFKEGAALTPDRPGESSDTPGTTIATAGGLKETIKKQIVNIGAMDSFILNMDKQIARVKEISSSIKSFDTRLLNVPLQIFKEKIAGDPTRSKYNMYVTELETEAGKLSTNTQSIAALPEGLREAWAHIHDRRLSIEDMASLLEETKHAGVLRRDGAKEALDSAKEQLNHVGKNRPKSEGGSKQDGYSPKRPAGIPPGATLVTGASTPSGHKFYSFKGSYWDATTGKRLNNHGE